MPDEDFLNQLNKGDKVWLVTDTLNIAEDVVLTAAKDESTGRNKFIHLRNSKRVLTWKDRHYIYQNHQLAKLRIVVQSILHSDLIIWDDELRKLMTDTNTPAVPPVPKSV
jgi:capsule polysaccharide export protein KpsE/RkpR